MAEIRLFELILRSPPSCGGRQTGMQSVQQRATGSVQRIPGGSTVISFEVLSAVQRRLLDDPGIPSQVT